MELLYFLGRLHVLVLHLPIGILLLAVLLETLSRRQRFGHLHGAVGFVWATGALSAIGTVMLGFLHASEGGFEGDALTAHRMAGTSLALLACAIWLARASAAALYRRFWAVGSLGILLLLVVTGHFGGNLTHGDTYLAEYAPAPLRSLPGFRKPEAARAAPHSLEAADIYLDIVAPALQQRCATCHNESKRKGGFSVVTYDALMAGGEEGVVIVAGKPGDSDLIRRINLDAAHEDFMPKDGKTPLTAQQAAAVAWWVSVGAPRTGAVATWKPDPETRAVLAGVIGLGGASAAQKSESGELPLDGSTAAEHPPGLEPPAAKAVSALESSGFVVRPISRDSPLVQVDYTAHRKLTDADLAALAVVCPNIHALNLRNAGLLDRHLGVIGKCANLVHLRLEMNPITDAGLPQLQALGKLEYLNLYGTRISDRGVPSLAGLPKLHDLFLWQTAVTPTGVAQLKSARADLNVNGGFDPRTFPVGPKVIPVIN